jgi:signal transduction histidine kinase
VLDALVAIAFCGAAVGLWRLRLNAAAVLAAGTGTAWLLGDLGGALVFVHRGPLVHLLLSYPRGRPHRRTTGIVVLTAYIDAVGYPLGRVDAVTVALATAAVAAALSGYLRSAGLIRRARLTPLLAMVGVGTVLSAGAVARLAGRPHDQMVLSAYETVLIVVAGVVYADARWGRWSRSALAGLVVHLGDAVAPTPLRNSLAAALGDPSLLVGDPAPSGHGLVDETGRPLTPAAADGARSVTEVRDGDQVLAVLMHDPAVLGDPALLEAVAGLARVALANIGLRATVLDTVAELEASRRRLLEVADAERERLAGDLAGGALARLDRARPLLTDGLRAELDECRRTLSDFARGVHPQLLTEGGLAAAVTLLAAAMPMRVAVDLTASRFRPAVETAAYFICAEALTNVAKYAPTASARVTIGVDAAALTVEVSDDGPGGADPSRGSGLRGLADRVDVLDGAFTVDSRPGHGTTVRAVLPLSSAAPAPEAGSAG